MPNKLKEQTEKNEDWIELTYETLFLIKLTKEWEDILSDFCLKIKQNAVDIPIFERLNDNRVKIIFRHFLWIFWNHSPLPFFNLQLFNEVKILKPSQKKLDTIRIAHEWIDRILN